MEALKILMRGIKPAIHGFIMASYIQETAAELPLGGQSVAVHASVEGATHSDHDFVVDVLRMFFRSMCIQSFSVPWYFVRPESTDLNPMMLPFSGRRTCRVGAPAYLAPGMNRSCVALKGHSRIKVFGSTDVTRCWEVATADPPRWWRDP